MGNWKLAVLTILVSLTKSSVNKNNFIDVI